MSTSVNGYSIDLRQDGRHRLNPLDADGDGVADGQSLTGETGKMTNVTGTGQAVQTATLRAANNATNANATANNTAITHTLNARGLELNDRGLASRDGFNVTGPNSRAALDFTGPPTLPENTTMTPLGATHALTHTGTVGANHTAINPVGAGNQNAGRIGAVGNGGANGLRAVGANAAANTNSSMGNMESRLSDYMARTNDGDAALMWQSLATMAKTSAIDTHMATELKSAMQKGKVDSKKNEIKATEEQIQAEREAAAMNLMFSIAAAVVQIALAGTPVGQAIGPALGQLIKSLGEYINKTSGPQRTADEKKIEVMRHQMMQEIFEQGVENAKSNYDEARELLKLALKIITEHSERQTQISTTITRT